MIFWPTFTGSPACTTNDGTFTNAMRSTFPKAPPATFRPDPRPRPHRSDRRIDGDLLAVAAGHDQPALERDGQGRDDAVAGHRGVAVAVHEEQARVGRWKYGFGEERAGHVGVAPRLEHERAAPVVRMAGQPVSLLEHRPAAWRREAVDDQPDRGHLRHARRWCG